MTLTDTLKFIVDHPLNRGAKLRALARFVRWQVGSRMLGSPVVYPWIHGARMIVHTGETGLTGNIYCGLHELEDMAYLLHVLRGSELFVDVGANAGSYTILAGACAGARVYAFEPVLSTFSRLLDNVRINHLESRVRCFNLGLAAGEGELAFTVDLNTENHVVADAERTENTVTVAVTTLDSALRKESPSLIKIDAEGYEPPILEGAAKTLEDPELHSVILEIGAGDRYGHAESETFRWMLDYDFRAHRYDPFTRKLAPFDVTDQRHGNVLFVRDVERISGRLESAPRFRVLGKAV